MSKIKSVNFLHLITLPNHSQPELNKAEVSAKLNIEFDVSGVTLTWHEVHPTDAHVDISKNPLCKVFVPTHMIKQVTFEAENVETYVPVKYDTAKLVESLLEAKRKPGRPFKKS